MKLSIQRGVRIPMIAEQSGGYHKRNINNILIFFSRFFALNGYYDSLNIEVKNTLI